MYSESVSVKQISSSSQTDPKKVASKKILHGFWRVSRFSLSEVDSNLEFLSAENACRCLQAIVEISRKAYECSKSFRKFKKIENFSHQNVQHTSRSTA